MHVSFTSRLRQIIFLPLFFINFLVFSQSTTKVFYDSDWKVTGNSAAPYYRIITRDANGQISGKVKDYYANGVLQWEGYLSYVDAYDSTKDLHSGPAVWFHPNGIKSQEVNYSNNLLHGTKRLWGEDGYLLSETDYVNGVLHGKTLIYYPKSTQVFEKYTYNNGVLHGPLETYHKNGKLYYTLQYLNGKTTQYWLSLYPLEGNTNYLFYDDFRDKNNPNGFTLANLTTAESKITDAGLQMEIKTQGPFAAWFNPPQAYGDVSELSAEFEFVSGDNQTGLGFSFLFSDWNNYNYLIVERSGFAKIGIVKNGKTKEFYQYLTVLKNRNKIKFFYKDGYILTVNGSDFPLINFDYDYFTKFKSSDLNFTGKNLAGLFLKGGPSKIHVKNFTALLSKG